MTKPKPITVWEVTIPFIFVFNYFKRKGAREMFVKNFLFTKELALQAAFDMIKKNERRKSVMSRIKEKTSDILTSDKQGIYSEKIRRKQMAEIELLIDHYSTLLKAEGKNYNALVEDAYQNREKYTIFLEQQMEASKMVMQAATQTLGTKANQGVVSRIETATEQVMWRDVEKIFGPVTQGNRPR